MKKAVLIVLLITAITFSLSFIGTDSVAYAEEITPVANGVYRAAADITVYTTILKSGETALFTIPNTYYFEIVEYYEGVYYVKYNDDDADYYIKPDANFVALTDKDTGTLGGFSTELTLTEDTTFNKRVGTRINDVAVTVADTTSISFMGFGKNDDDVDCAYVLLNNANYGYLPVASLKIKGTDTMLADYTIDLHPNYRTSVTDKTSDGSKNTDNAKLIRTILIIGIVVPALIIMFLLFKPSKKSRYDYDRNRSVDSGTSPYDNPRSRYRDDEYYNRPRRGHDDYDDDYYDNRGGRRY